MKLLFFIFITLSTNLFASYDFFVSSPDEIKSYTNMFEGIAMIFNSADYLSLLKFLFLFGSFAVFAIGVIQSTSPVFDIEKSQKDTSKPSTAISNVTKYAAFTVAILSILFSVKSDVFVKTYNIPTFKSITSTEVSSIAIADIPLPIAYLFSTINRATNSITNILESSYAIPSIHGNIYNLNQSGYAGAIKNAQTLLSADLTKILNDSELNYLTQKLFKECLFIPLSGKGLDGMSELAKFKSSNNILLYLDNLYTTNSLYGGIPISEFSANVSGQTYRCGDLYSQLKSKININKAGIPDNFPSISSSTIFALTGNTSPDIPTFQDMSIQSGLINAIKESQSDSYTQGINYLKGKDKKLETQSFQGRFFASILPEFHSTLRSIIFSFIPFTLIIIILPGGLNVLKQYLKTIIWIESWIPLASILNMFITQKLSYENTLLYSNGGLSSSLHHIFLENIENVSNTAWYLYLFIPALSLSIVSGLSGGAELMSNIFGKLTGTSMELGSDGKTMTISKQKEKNSEEKLQDEIMKDVAEKSRKDQTDFVSLAEMQHYQALQQGATDGKILSYSADAGIELISDNELYKSARELENFKSTMELSGNASSSSISVARAQAKPLSIDSAANINIGQNQSFQELTSGIVSSKEKELIASGKIKKLLSEQNSQENFNLNEMMKTQKEFEENISFLDKFKKIINKSSDEALNSMVNIEALNQTGSFISQNASIEKANENNSFFKLMEDVGTSSAIKDVVNSQSLLSILDKTVKTSNGAYKKEIDLDARIEEIEKSLPEEIKAAMLLAGMSKEDIKTYLISNDKKSVLGNSKTTFSINTLINSSTYTKAKGIIDNLSKISFLESITNESFINAIKKTNALQIDITNGKNVTSINVNSKGSSIGIEETTHNASKEVEMARSSLQSHFGDYGLAITKASDFINNLKELFSPISVALAYHKSRKFGNIRDDLESKAKEIKEKVKDKIDQLKENRKLNSLKLIEDNHILIDEAKEISNQKSIDAQIKKDMAIEKAKAEHILTQGSDSSLVKKYSIKAADAQQIISDLSKNNTHFARIVLDDYATSLDKTKELLETKTSSKSHLGSITKSIAENETIINEFKSKMASSIDPSEINKFKDQINELEKSNNSLKNSFNEKKLELEKINKNLSDLSPEIEANRKLLNADKASFDDFSKIKDDFNHKSFEIQELSNLRSNPNLSEIELSKIDSDLNQLKLDKENLLKEIQIKEESLIKGMKNPDAISFVKMEENIEKLNQKINSLESKSFNIEQKITNAEKIIQQSSNPEDILKAKSEITYNQLELEKINAEKNGLETRSHKLESQVDHIKKLIENPEIKNIIDDNKKLKLDNLSIQRELDEITKVISDPTLNLQDKIDDIEKQYHSDLDKIEEEKLKSIDSANENIKKANQQIFNDKSISEKREILSAESKELHQKISAAKDIDLKITEVNKTLLNDPTNKSAIESLNKLMDERSTISAFSKDELEHAYETIYNKNESEIQKTQRDLKTLSKIEKLEQRIEYLEETRKQYKNDSKKLAEIDSKIKDAETSLDKISKGKPTLSHSELVQKISEINQKQVDLTSSSKYEKVSMAEEFIGEKIKSSELKKLEKSLNETKQKLEDHKNQTSLNKKIDEVKTKLNSAPLKLTKSEISDLKKELSYLESKKTGFIEKGYRKLINDSTSAEILSEIKSIKRSISSIESANNPMLAKKLSHENKVERINKAHNNFTKMEESLAEKEAKKEMEEALKRPTPYQTIKGSLKSVLRAPGAVLAAPGATIKGVGKITAVGAASIALESVLEDVDHIAAKAALAFIKTGDNLIFEAGVEGSKGVYYSGKLAYNTYGIENKGLANEAINQLDEVGKKFTDTSISGNVILNSGTEGVNLLEDHFKKHKYAKLASEIFNMPSDILSGEFSKSVNDVSKAYKAGHNNESFSDSINPVSAVFTTLFSYGIKIGNEIKKNDLDSFDGIKTFAELQIEDFKKYEEAKYSKIQNNNELGETQDFNEYNFIPEKNYTAEALSNISSNVINTSTDFILDLFGFGNKE